MRNLINILKTLWNQASGRQVQGIMHAIFGSFFTSFVGKISFALLTLLGFFFQVDGIGSPFQDSRCFGIVTVDENLMRTDTGDPDEFITEIRIYESPGQTNLVYYEIGCFEPTCTSDLSHLDEGRYYVVVITETGSFSDTIQLD